VSDTHAEGEIQEQVGPRPPFMSTQVRQITATAGCCTLRSWKLQSHLAARRKSGVRVDSVIRIIEATLWTKASPAGWCLRCGPGEFHSHFTGRANSGARVNCALQCSGWFHPRTTPTNTACACRSAGFSVHRHARTPDLAPVTTDSWHDTFKYLGLAPSLMR
jgi:hypothetical protein